jgi:thioredoxin reductase
MIDTLLPVLTPDVLIIGAGPAGLTAARRLAQRANGEVLVLEREQTAGGIPRHSNHLGYGIRDLHRVLSGPDYARRLSAAAADAGATISTGAMVTNWVGDHSVEVTTPQGRLRVDPRAIVLATGARERPRSARLIPGWRPQGVYTTGHLQNLVHLHHGAVGRNAVVIGAELVSWSAVMTLREAGCRTVLMATRHRSPEAYAAFHICGRTLLRVPIATRTRITRITGYRRVEAVELENLDTGVRRLVDCDTLVLTGDWIPDHELVRSAGLDLDPATNGPLVDTALRTSRPGVFAVGNLVHAVDTADVAALDGEHVANQVITWLNGVQRVESKGIRLLADAPFRWIAPGLIRPGNPAPARRRLLLWTDELIRFPRIAIRQNGQVMAQRRLPCPASPGRVFRAPSSMLDSINPDRGDVRVGLS